MNNRHVAHIELREGITPIVATIDCLVFDIDGVLIDATESYPAAILDALKTYTMQTFPDQRALAESFHVDDIFHFKAAGGFNDEWDLAYAGALWIVWHALDCGAPALGDYTEAIKESGGGLAGTLAILAQHGVEQWVVSRCNKDTVMRLAQESYAGADACATLFGFHAQFMTNPGRHHLERALLPPAALEPHRGHLALYTGRNDQETDFVLKSFRLDAFFPKSLRITASSGIKKPSPKGLRILLTSLPHRAALFVGDTLDDARAAERYRRLYPHSPLLFAGITGGAMGRNSREVFTHSEADIIAPTTQQLLDYLQTVSEESP